MHKALFLDRDGIINLDEKGYTYKIEDFHFIDGIFELATYAQAKGYTLFVVTNQSGIARGYYTEKDFLDVTDYMLNCFQANNILISKVYYCPYHPDGSIMRYKMESNDRKPNPGMLLKAEKEFNLDLRSSVIIGDKETDIVAGKKANIGKTILVTNHHGHSQADYVFNDLLEVKGVL